MKPATPRKRCLTALGSALAVLILSHGVSRSDDAADQKQLAKFKKKVESAVKKGKGDYYAVVLFKSTYHQDEVQRSTVRQVLVGGQVLQETAVEIKSGEYCPEQDFQVMEGGDVVVDAVLTHMKPFLHLPEKKKAKQPSNDDPTPTTGDWKLIGRFVDAEKAGEALENAKTAFDSEPHWQPKKKD